MHARLAAVRAVHSAIFLVELWAIAWLVATGLARRGGRSVRVAAVLVAGESAVFVGNRGVCPLTPLAERYGADRGSVSDIFLPDALARTIPFWSIPLVVLGLGLHARNRVAARSSAGRVPPPGRARPRRTPPGRGVADAARGSNMRA